MYSKPLVLISWNVRGMCSQARQTYAKQMVLDEKADIVLLQETKTGDLVMYMRNYVCIVVKVKLKRKGKRVVGFFV